MEMWHSFYQSGPSLSPSRKIYLSRYESLNEYCSDPFSVHKKPIKSKFNIVFMKFMTWKYTNFFLFI